MRWWDDPVMVEEEGEGSASDVQCPHRDRRREADVPISVPAHPMPDPGERLLRVGRYFLIRNQPVSITPNSTVRRSPC
jgi:hypothetical protein